MLHLCIHVRAQSWPLAQSWPRDMGQNKKVTLPHNMGFHNSEQIEKFVKNFSKRFFSSSKLKWSNSENHKAPYVSSPFFPIFPQMSICGLIFPVLWNRAGVSIRAPYGAINTITDGGSTAPHSTGGWLDWILLRMLLLVLLEHLTESKEKEAGERWGEGKESRVGGSGWQLLLLCRQHFRLRFSICQTQPK